MTHEQQQLVQRIRAGDRVAEREFFLHYKNPILWKICRSIKTDPENVKDVAGEVYLAIIEGLRKPNFQCDQWDSLEAYIWGVTNNKIRDWFKSEKRKNQIFADDPPSADIAAASDEYFLETQELENLLRATLNTLEYKFKEVLDLRYFNELSVQEIGAQLGIPPRRVSERIHYALRLLRKAYQKMGKSLSILGLISLLFK